MVLVPSAYSSVLPLGFSALYHGSDATLRRVKMQSFPYKKPFGYSIKNTYGPSSWQSTGNPNILYNVHKGTLWVPRKSGLYFYPYNFALKSTPSNNFQKCHIKTNWTPTNTILIMIKRRGKFLKRTKTETHLFHKFTFPILPCIPEEEEALYNKLFCSLFFYLDVGSRGLYYIEDGKPSQRSGGKR